MKLKALKRLNIYHLAVFFICIFHLGMNLLWLSKNTAPVPWDQAGHTLTAMNFAQQFSNLSSFDLKAFIHTSDYYPPLTHIAVAILMNLTQSYSLVGPLTMTALFLASIVLVYAILVKLWNNKAAGLIACSAFSLLPPVYDQSRWFMLEIPLIFLLLLTYYYLLTAKLNNLRRLVGLSLLILAGFLTKWTFPVYIILPLIYKFIKEKPYRLHLTIALLLGCFLALPWYVANYNTILGTLSWSITPELDDPQNPLSAENLAANWTFLFNQMFNWVGFILIAISSYKLVKSKDWKSVMILVNLVFIVLLFTFVPNKNLRYILPVSILGSLLIGRLFVVSGKKLLYFTLFCVFGIYLIGYYFVLSFGWPINCRDMDHVPTFQVPIIGFVNLNSCGSAEIYNNTVWAHSEIINTIEKDSPNSVAPLLALVLTDKKYLNRENITLSYRLIKRKAEIIFARPSDFLTPTTQFQYIIGTDDLGPIEAIRDLEAFIKYRDTFANSSGSDLLNSIILPDNDQVYIYRTNAQDSK